ncbi:hypothetical protein J6590_048739 [Homalodisca vitripennis]|nr:hypothetical protein J6590_048739 [Homalodisca vitripennis]
MATCSSCLSCIRADVKVDVGFLAITRLVSAVTLYLGCLLASSWMHNYMLNNILHSPGSFFDTTPVGRILNRFSKDVDTLDNTLPQNIFSLITCLFSRSLSSC